MRRRLFLGFHVFQRIVLDRPAYHACFHRKIEKMHHLRKVTFGFAPHLFESHHQQFAPVRLGSVQPGIRMVFPQAERIHTLEQKLVEECVEIFPRHAQGSLIRELGEHDVPGIAGQIDSFLIGFPIKLMRLNQASTARQQRMGPGMFSDVRAELVHILEAARLPGEKFHQNEAQPGAA